jgi:hypothetical protein
VKVRVIRRIEFEVAPLDGRKRVFEHVMTQPRHINDGGIARQSHALFQSSLEYTRDHRPLHRVGRFLLHQRCQGDHVAQSSSRTVDIRLELRIQESAKTRHHCFDHRLSRHAARKAVRVGEKVSFEGRRLRIEIANRRSVLREAEKLGRIHTQGLLKNFGDVESVRAFRNEHRVEVDIASNQLLVNVDGAQRPIEKVFASLHPSAERAAGKIAQKERPSAGQHASLD